MKKFFAPLILFAGSFLCTWLLQRYTFIYQEYTGLFLNTGDYFSSMFRGSLPISGVIGDFLTQFFRFSVYAPLIVSLGVVLAYFLTRSIFSRLGLGWDVLAAACACGLWVVIAMAPTARRGVFVLLILLAVWALSRLLQRKKAKSLPLAWELGGALFLTAGVCLFIGLNPKLRETEKTAELRVAVANYDWDRVLAIATPAETALDRSLLPFAGLALGEKGQLANRLFLYPLHEQADFDFNQLEDNETVLFFKAMLYETLHCPNEAIHNFAQLATLQDHGLSFLVLRHLLADNYQMGNYALARKFGTILSRSTLHGQYVSHFNALMEQGTPHAPDSVGFRKTVPLISHDPLYNLLLLESNGMRSPAAVDRILCTLLLQRKLDRFQSLLLSVQDRYPTLPRYYEEALLLGGNPPLPVSEATRRRYADFQSAASRLSPAEVQKKYADTYWIYFVSVPAER